MHDSIYKFDDVATNRLLVDLLESENADLKQLIADLIYVAEYDFENCDFGPAYGLNKAFKEKILRQAKRASRGFKVSK